MKGQPVSPRRRIATVCVEEVTDVVGRGRAKEMTSDQWSAPVNGVSSRGGPPRTEAGIHLKTVGNSVGGGTNRTLLEQPVKLVSPAVVKLANDGATAQKKATLTSRHGPFAIKNNARSARNGVNWFRAAGSEAQASAAGGPRDRVVWEETETITRVGQKPLSTHCGETLFKCPSAGRGSLRTVGSVGARGKQRTREENGFGTEFKRNISHETCEANSLKATPKTTGDIKESVVIRVKETVEVFEDSKKVEHSERLLLNTVDLTQELGPKLTQRKCSGRMCRGEPSLPITM